MWRSCDITFLPYLTYYCLLSPPCSTAHLKHSSQNVKYVYNVLMRLLDHWAHQQRRGRCPDPDAMRGRHLRRESQWHTAKPVLTWKGSKQISLRWCDRCWSFTSSRRSDVGTWSFLGCLIMESQSSNHDKGIHFDLQSDESFLFFFSAYFQAQIIPSHSELEVRISSFYILWYMIRLIIIDFSWLKQIWDNSVPNLSLSPT